MTTTRDEEPPARDDNDELARLESALQSGGALAGRGGELARRGGELARRGGELARRGGELAERARNLSMTAVNLVASAGVLVSVVLGTRSIGVSDQQLDLAKSQIETSQAQIETSKELAASVEVSSGGRGAAWEEALEAMLINDAIVAGNHAFVRSFEPPDTLRVGGEPVFVTIAVQNLATEPLRTQIEGGATERVLCQLPGCTEAGAEDCPCYNPLVYEFVLEPMRESRVALPIVLDVAEAQDCPRRLELTYALKLQDEKGVLRPLTKRKIIYRRRDRGHGCDVGLEYDFGDEDSWAGALAVAGETESDVGETESDDEVVLDEADTPEASADAGEAAPASE